MKEFVTAAQEVLDETEEQKGVVFRVDDEELRYYQPTQPQLAMLMATVSQHSAAHNQIAGIINFFVAVLDKPSHAYITDRLLDRDDPFGLEEVTEIMSWMVEEWTGRPMPPPSVSTRSRSNGGRKSTPPTPVPTSSDSVPSDS